MEPRSASRLPMQWPAACHRQMGMQILGRMMDAHTQSTRGEPDAPPGITIQCSACNADTVADARFCSSCGVALAEIEDATLAARPIAVLEALQRRVTAGELHESIPEMEQLIVAHPDWASAQLSLGIAYLRVGRIHDAQDALERAQQLAPENFSCEVAFAEMQARLGFFDQSVKHLDRALKIGAPTQSALSAALDLQRYCRDHAKKLYYRQLAFPRWPFSWPKQFASRAAALNLATSRSTEA